MGCGTFLLRSPTTFSYKLLSPVHSHTVDVCGGGDNDRMPLSLRTALLDTLLFILAAQLVLTQGGKVHVIGSSDKLCSFGFLYT